jgi:hypothetical protein
MDNPLIATKPQGYYCRSDTKGEFDRQLRLPSQSLPLIASLMLDRQVDSMIGFQFRSTD